MQLSFQQKEHFFHELAQMARSGISFVAALESMERTRHGAIGHCAARLLRGWTATASSSEAFRQAGFAPRDIAIVDAGDHAGRLAEVFTKLSAYYAQMARARSVIIAKSLYPLFILVFGVVVLAIPPAIMDGGWGGFFVTVVGTLLVIFLGLALLLGGVAFLLRQAASNAPLARALAAVPILGGFFRDWSAWNYAQVVSLYVKAGGGLLKAFQAAAGACANAALAQTTTAAISRVQQGQGLAESFQRSRDVPEMLLTAMDVGERAGRLDEEMARAALFFKTRVLDGLDRFAEWAPRLLYVVVVLYTAWRIISMAMGIGDSYGQVLDGASM